MITLDFDTTVDEVLMGLSRDSRAVDKAIKRAVRKTSLYVRRLVTQTIAQKTGIAQKNIAMYHRISLRVNDADAVIWVGLNNLPLYLAGRVSWNRRKSGARVRGRVYNGAFMMPGRGKSVWIRTDRNQSAGHDTYGKILRSPSQRDAWHFPIQQLGLSLESVEPDIEIKVKQLTLTFFKKRLHEELNYALNHE